MKVFGANMSYRVSDFLNENLKELFTFEQANEKIYQSSGIQNFFENKEELKLLKKFIAATKNLVKEPDRAEYGDFQTNMSLANKSAYYLSSKNISPHILIEPTCGKGNFIVASLDQFSELQKVFGVEIYKPYVWKCKFNIIDFYLKDTKANKLNTLKQNILKHINTCWNIKKTLKKENQVSTKTNLYSQFLVLAAILSNHTK